MGRFQAQELTHRDALCWDGDGQIMSYRRKARMSGVGEGGAGGSGEAGMCTSVGSPQPVGQPCESLQNPMPN